MKYRVTIEGREREVDVTLTPDGGASVALDGKPVDADVQRVPGGVCLRIGHRVFDLAIGGKPEQLQLASRGDRAIADVQSERARAKAKKSGAIGGSSKELRAPMPGRVVKVLVAVGDEVAAGAPCVVIEAMKMENELRAAGAGKVASIKVREGGAVEAQAVLLTFE